MQNVPGGDNVDCGDTVKDLQANPDSYAYNRNVLGKPIYCQGEVLSKPINFTRATVGYKWNSIIGLIIRFIQDFTASVGWNGNIDSKLYDLGADTTSPQDQQHPVVIENKKTWRDFLAGYIPTNEEKKMGCSDNGDCSNQDFINNASAIEKLSPYESMNANKEWKPTEIADREKILCQILSGYKKSIYGSSGDLEPTHDYVSGYISSRGVTAMPPENGTNRPLYGIEIICSNSKLVCPGISNGEKGNICNEITGGGNKITADSKLGSKFSSQQLELAIPSLSCMYNKGKGCGALYYLPRVPIEENFGTMCQKGLLGNYLSCPQIAVPDAAAKSISEKILSFFSTLDDQKKDKSYDYASKQENGLNAKYSSEWVGNKSISGTTQFNLTVNPPPREIRNVQGATTDINGDVLAAESITAPDYEPIAGPPVTQLQDMEYDLYAPKSAMETAYNLTRLGMNFLPYDMTKTLLKPVAGTPPVIFPVKNGITFNVSDADAFIEGPSTTQFPFLGGPLLVFDPEMGVARRMMTRPYDPMWYPTEETGPYVRQLAVKQDLEDLAKSPWINLLSFQKIKADEDLSKK